MLYKVIRKIHQMKLLKKEKIKYSEMNLLLSFQDILNT